MRTEGTQASGGVGGTRVGVKCLHAHLANYLVGDDDPVGELVARELVVPELTIEDLSWLRSSRHSTVAATRRDC